jgi:inhibitor of cysteine peptidase
MNMKKGKAPILLLIVTIGLISALSINVEYSTMDLKKFRSYQELKDFLNSRMYDFRRGLYLSTLDKLGTTAYVDESAVGYSKTNVQVEGVDEADTVKTDGEYLYITAGQEVIIARTYPAEEAAIVARILVAGVSSQLLISQDRLAVFYENNNQDKTFVRVYDISVKESPFLVREVSTDGYYVSSRLVGDYAYVITTKGAWIINDQVSLPRISSVDGNEEVDATEVYYEDTADNGYVFTTVLAFNMQHDQQKPEHTVILSGWASTLYVSKRNIYLACNHISTTIVHRIQIENGEICIAADGEIPGTVLNQFSMDEYNAYFRVATTSTITSPGEEPFMLHLQNNIYVLDMDLTVVGKIEGLAKGETVHSARFMGSSCYLVTFRKVDPFFVIDLSEPTGPKVLGELKVTGYSDYMHMYDENHVIGVGKETVGADQGDFSWYQGLKISLFDVTEISDPKELARYLIGDRGTNSPVLNDHKAFLFNEEKHLLVIPVLVAKTNERNYPNGVPQYAMGENVWQGAYVFTVSLAGREIKLKGTITHIENGDVSDYTKHVKRALYIGDVLYTVSDSMVKMNSLTDLSDINALTLG